MNWHEKEQEFTKLTKKNFEHFLKWDCSDSELIEKMVGLFIEFYSQFADGTNVSKPIVEDMLRDYTNSKCHLYKLIGDVRVSMEVDNIKGTATFRKELKDSIDEAVIDIRSKYKDINGEDVSEKDKSEYINLKTLKSNKPLGFNFNEIYSNKSNGGSKPSKMFAKVFGADSIATTIYSNTIQNNTIKETAYISISPLDFLTMSENNYGWQSCLRMGGEYSAGALSYILDSTTTVSFIGKYNKEFCALDKKWRQLVYIGSNGKSIYVSQSRHYPTEMTSVETDIRRKLKYLINDFVGENLTYIKVNPKNGFYNHGHAPHYFDLDRKHYGITGTHDKIIDFKDSDFVGALSYCLDCGEEVHRGDHTFGFMCDECGGGGSPF